MGDEVVRIVHVSDLHISEHLFDEPDKDLKLPHRYGHNVTAFLALDTALRKLEWDALVLSGDVSRIGFRNSFFLVRNWIENTLFYGGRQLGLETRASGKPYVIVPGNHDRFNEQLRQDTLDNYFMEFPRFQSGDVVQHQLKGRMFNFHLFDSTSGDGGFALGKLEQREMVPKVLKDDEIDIAVLHHHVVQPPRHAREPDTEIINSKEVLAYFLSCGFDAILFGHTHNFYGEIFPAGLVSAKMKDRRGKRSIFRRFVPKFLVRRWAPNDWAVSYPRERTADGRYPSFSSYLEYLYLRDVQGLELKRVGEFASVRTFYRYVAQQGSPLRAQLDSLKRKRVAVSMAPSACQSEEPENGFMLLEFHFSGTALQKIGFEVHAFDGNLFGRRSRRMFHMA